MTWDDRAERPLGVWQAAVTGQQGTEVADFRTEHDSLGEILVPAKVLWGAQTQRALENFPVSGLKPSPDLVWATVLVKKAAAKVNAGLGLLQPRLARAIQDAADEVLEGKHRDQFVVDPFQAGAGTSHHMNVNEVLANRANEILGGRRGRYSPVHPNDHVNYGQSTNDVFPTAMRLAALRAWSRLKPVLVELTQALLRKAREFDEVVTSARTHLQDAVPIRLGQQFGSYASAVATSLDRIETAAARLQELGIGGTAAGTGLNTHPEYRKRVVEELSRQTGWPLKPASDLFWAMSSMAPFVDFSSALRELALELTRIANDLRLLSSGPTTGLSEIHLPAVQPGSSIMPGKVNPVMAEMLNMVCYQVIGNDAAVALAAQAGQLQLNVLMPVIIFNLLTSLTLLTNGLRVFRQKLVEGITADRERCRLYFERSLGLATVLNQIVGYEAAAALVRDALAEGKSVLALVVERGILSEDEVKGIFDPRRITEPGIIGQKGGSSADGEG